MQCGSSCCVNGFLFFIVYSDEVNAAFCPEISLDPEKLFFTLWCIQSYVLQDWHSHWGGCPDKCVFISPRLFIWEAKWKELLCLHMPDVVANKFCLLGI